MKQADRNGENENSVICVATESQKCWLEGTFGGHIVQVPPKSRTSAALDQC